MMDIDQLMWDSGMTEWFNADLASFTALKSAAGKIAALVAAAERERCATACHKISIIEGISRDGYESAIECRLAIRALP